LKSFRQKFSGYIDGFRHRLSYHDALPPLIALGILSGIAAALIIVAFRILVEGPLSYLLDGEVDNFESLPMTARFLLPLAGAITIGAMLHCIDKKYHATSVNHVLDRLNNFQGRLPKENLLVQFFGGALALISGQSIGREGPGVHLGAGIASLLGQWFHLPHNSLRTLIACGSAAAIAASFDTPMAGVIFAMEVVLMEYTITGFIPVIIAAVLGATISQLVFGPSISFEIASTTFNSLWELPFLVFSGLVFAVLAALFIRLQLWFARLQNRPVLLRFTAIGLATGLLSLFVPQIMGTGYDTLNAEIIGQYTIQLLVLIVISKLLITAMVTGLGMVGGVIGPSLVIGAGVGSLLGSFGNMLVPMASDSNLYVILGMAAMMGALLNAPLAALIAILELSANPAVIFPSMVIVVVACAGVKLFFNYDGLFAEQLKAQGHRFLDEPGRGFLSRIGVQSVMNRSFISSNQYISIEAARILTGAKKLWVLIDKGEQAYTLFSTADLAKYLDKINAANDTQNQKNIDMLDIPARRYNVELIDSLESLYEASKLLRQSDIDALAVKHYTHSDRFPVIGILTEETIKTYYGV